MTESSPIPGVPRAGTTGPLREPQYVCSQREAFSSKQVFGAAMEYLAPKGTRS